MAGASSRGFLPLSATASTYTANRHRVSPEFYRVAQLRTDGVEFAGTGPVVLKVSYSNGCAAFSGVTMDQFLCPSLLPRPLLVYVVVDVVIEEVSQRVSNDQ